MGIANLPFPGYFMNDLYTGSPVKFRSPQAAPLSSLVNFGFTNISVCVPVFSDLRSRISTEKCVLY